MGISSAPILRSAIGMLVLLGLASTHLQAQTNGATDFERVGDPFDGSSSSLSIQLVPRAHPSSGKEKLLPQDTEETPVHHDRVEETALMLSLEPEKTLEPGWVHFPVLSVAMTSWLKQVVLSDGVLALPPQRTEHIESKEIKAAWEGNVPKHQAHIDRLMLRFERDDKSIRSATPNLDPDHFILGLSFHGKSIEITHSHHGGAGRGRLDLVASPRLSERRYIKGKGSSGMAVYVPRTAFTDADPRYLMLCPRSEYRLDRRRGHDELFYVESPYRITRVLAGVRADVSGRALSARELARARAQILTSPGIPRARAADDESISIDPQVALSYVPRTGELVDEESVGGQYIAGIETRLELQRSSGVQRETRHRRVAWVVPSNLGSDEPWFIGALKGKTAARVAPGACYHVLVATQSEALFERSAFQVPENLSSEG